jgi:cation transport ATPase
MARSFSMRPPWNEQSVTGESLPVIRRAGDAVLSGTLYWMGRSTFAPARQLTRERWLG